MTLVKSAPKKPNFLGALFTKDICTLYIFEISTGSFHGPCDLFKEKKFSSLRRDNKLFRELKRLKIEETAQNFEKLFVINRS
jgi:hypothetical protein